MSTANQLLQYKTPDMENDFALELRDITDYPIDQCREMVSIVLESYRIGRTAPPEEVPRSLFLIIIGITQPLRIPLMTLRMDPVLKILNETRNLRSCLDYGGGGGKDSILYAKSGFDVTYSDLLDDTTALVLARFQCRDLEVTVRDVRDLGEDRFDIVNCMDVIEHVYDVEDVVADLIARVSSGGRLVVYPQFTNSWDGDHVEKNCGYRPYFQSMLEEVGMQLAPDSASSKTLIEKLLIRLGLGELSVMQFVRLEEIKFSVVDERKYLREALYRLSRKKSIRMALLAFVILPGISAISALLYPTKYRSPATKARQFTFSQIIDNLAIWRLSGHQLQVLEKKL